MTEKFHSSKPIYEQIGELMIKRMIRGELAPGDKLPSVRELAIEVSVNPNTVSRTYRELEMMNAVESRRGQGTFVTEDETVIAALRKDMKTEILSNFTEEMLEMGYTTAEIQEGLNRFLAEKGEEG
jgi:DNA-binding transcriptional regulator YhcF (GntR family)